MSTLVLMLTAAMAVPGNGPEMVSGEVKLTDPLDLSGEWLGVWKVYKTEYEVEQIDGRGAWSIRGFPKGIQAGMRGSFYLTPNVTDEGEGRLLLKWLYPSLGIYHQDGDDLIICFRDAREGRPLSFRVGDGDLLILHRVKPKYERQKDGEPKKVRPKKDEPREQVGELIKVRPKEKEPPHRVKPRK
jgi:hypothetical protein